MENTTVYALLSTLSIVAGLGLLIYMVTVEGEPGGIPLLLVAVGTGGYALSHYREQPNQ